MTDGVGKYRVTVEVHDLRDDRVLARAEVAEMNFPGRSSSNWQWRFTTGQVNQHVIDQLADITWLYGRRNPAWGRG